MPILGADMTAGTLIAWRKQPGERVTRGDVIAEVETEKGLIDVEVFVTGVVERILVTPGTTVPAGTVLAVIQEDVAAAPPRAPAPPPVDLATVRGSGAIATAMARAKREIPHYYLAHTIDMDRALTWLTNENAQRPVTERMLANVLLVKAVALAVREVLELNAVWRGSRAEPSARVHVGVAIFLRGGGLVAPALHDADRAPLGELMGALRDVVQRARAGGLRSSELSDPTITATSLGEQGVETVLPIVYQPQVAIVGFGRIAPRPWVVDGAVVARPLMSATLSADHRVSDGHRGGLLLVAIDRLLREPGRLR